MSEEQTQTTPEPVVTSEQGQQSTQIGTSANEPVGISTYIGDDGAFKEGWKEGLLDEESRKSGIYDRVKDVKSALATLAHQEKAISKKGIIPIDEHSTEQQIADYRKAIGVPEKPDAYQFNAPKGMEACYPKELMAEVNKDIHSLNLSQKQYEGMMALDAKRIQSMQVAEQQRLQESELKAETAIEAFCKDNKQKIVHNANLGINEVCKTANLTAEEREAVFGEGKGVNSAEGAQYRPTMLKIMSAIGTYYNEDSGIRIGQLADPATIDTQIKSVTDQLTEELKRTNRKQYDDLVAQKEALYKKRYPDR